MRLRVIIVGYGAACVLALGAGFVAAITVSPATGTVQPDSTGTPGVFAPPAPSGQDAPEAITERPAAQDVPLPQGMTSPSQANLSPAAASPSTSEAGHLVPGSGAEPHSRSSAPRGAAVPQRVAPQEAPRRSAPPRTAAPPPPPDPAPGPPPGPLLPIPTLTLRSIPRPPPPQLPPPGPNPLESFFDGLTG